jgi:CxxC motif-containing protein (DUF1111 family)
MNKAATAALSGFVLVALGTGLWFAGQHSPPQNSGNSHAAVKDPGLRTGPAGAGGPISGLDPATDLAAFMEGQKRFSEVDGLANGLGPRFNAESCAQCHAQPSLGGSSPLVNPQVDAATHLGAKNQVPSFITSSGPVREARFKKNADGTADGGVHDLFVITGRSDLPAGNTCAIKQDDFARELSKGNVSFRIPTPVFGAGLIEAIPDSAIVANKAADSQTKKSMGIEGHENKTAGHANHSGNDGTITRFGWKAQNKSLQIFAGEAYNVEQGVTNELFPTEREESAPCNFNTLPEDHTNFDKTGATDVPSDVVMFAEFMNKLAPPAAVNQDNPQVMRGRAVFAETGCAMCHTPAMRTGKASTPALSNQEVRLYSDLLVHHMGKGLNDGITQGNAGPDEFRTAPLWGVGQRTFFLHDGRTSDLLEAIRQHASPGSEANRVVKKFEDLSDADMQALLVFLRSL